MDAYKLEPPRPVRVRKASPLPAAVPWEDASKPPLDPSKKNNTALPFTRRTRTSDVPSRYKSGISSAPASTPGSPRRCASPTASRTALPQGTAQPKRALSAERKRPTSPSSRFSAPSARPSTPSSPSSRSTTPVRDALMETHNAARRLIGGRAPDGLWPSMRSLSSSFQSESCSIVVSRRDKLAGDSSSDQTVKYSGNASTERKRTSLPGRSISENYKPVEKSNVKVIDQHRWPAMLGGRVSSNALSMSIDLTDKAKRSIYSTGSPRGVSPRRALPTFDGANVSLHQSLSDVARRLTMDGSKRSEGDAKFSSKWSSKSSDRSSSATQPSRTVSLPTLVSLRPSSPIRNFPASSSTPRAMLSPSRMRSSTPTSPSNSAVLQMGATSSIFNYILDLRKGRRRENQIEDGHQLKLLYNSDLQWCFVNAHADDMHASQKMRTENLLCDAWNNITRLRDSVITKRVYVQHLRQEMKLFQILKEQITFLEHWVAVERGHCSALSGAFESLKESTLLLPVRGGAKADIRAVNGAISSAIDVMQAMGPTICYLLSKADSTRTLVSELQFAVAEEKAMLYECRELLASVGAMQVQESSLQAHLIQSRQDIKMEESSINFRLSNHQACVLLMANS